jgi:hypothetical protein
MSSNVDRTPSTRGRRVTGWTVALILTVVLTQMSAGLIAGIKAVTGWEWYFLILGWLAGGYLRLSATLAILAGAKIAPEIEGQSFVPVMVLVLIMLGVLDAIGAGGGLASWLNSLVMVGAGVVGANKAGDEA